MFGDDDVKLSSTGIGCGHGRASTSFDCTGTGYLLSRMGIQVVWLPSEELLPMIPFILHSSQAAL